jgi:branched-chain amino acid transport system permease protein
MIVQIFLNGLITGFLYSLVALGFSLIYASTRVFHIAHGAIYTASVYFFLFYDVSIKKFYIYQYSYSIFLYIILSVAASIALAILFEILIYRQLMKRKLSPLATFISSLGIYIIVVNLISLIFGNETKILHTQIEPSINIAGVIITRIQIIQIFVSASLIFIIMFILKKTSLGRKIRALSDNHILINLLGVNVKKVRLLVFAIGSLLAASSSLLTAFDVGVNPHVGLAVVLTATVAVIVAGIGSHWGAVIGALLIGFIQNVVVWFCSAQWQDAVTFIILTIVLFVRREGLFAIQLRLEEH